MIPCRSRGASGPVRRDVDARGRTRLRLGRIAGIAALALVLAGPALADPVLADEDASAASSGALFPTHPAPPPHPTPGLPATSLTTGIPLPSDDGRDPRFGSMPESDFGGDYYFYRGYSYGSASLNNPARMILNGP